MPEQPAVVSIHLDKSTPDHHFWMGFFKDLKDSSSVTDTSIVTVVNLWVQHYDLSDHQFVRVKVKVHKKSVVVLVPRRLVNLVVHGDGLEKTIPGFARTLAG